MFVNGQTVYQVIYGEAHDYELAKATVVIEDGKPFVYSPTGDGYYRKSSNFEDWQATPDTAISVWEAGELDDIERTRKLLLASVLLEG